MINLAWSNIGFGGATPVTTAAGQMRYVVPVPALNDGGVDFDLEQVAREHGGKASEYQPTKGRGAYFYNHVDAAWQGVHGDGSSVIVMSGVDTEKAHAITQIVKPKGQLSLPVVASDVTEFIGRVNNGVAVVDAYNSDRVWLHNNTPQKALKEGPFVFVHDGDYFGYLPKTSEGVLAVFVPSAFSFLNSQGVVQHFQEGGFVVKLSTPDGDMVSVHGIQQKEFMETYVLADGTKITIPEVVQQLSRTAVTSVADVMAKSLPELTVSRLTRLYEEAKARGPIGIHVKDPEQARRAAQEAVQGMYGPLIMEDVSKWLQIIEVAMLEGYPLNTELINIAIEVGDFGFTGFAYSIASKIIEEIWLYGDGFVDRSEAWLPVLRLQPQTRDNVVQLEAGNVLLLNNE